jgi:hypothetical protein
MKALAAIFALYGLCAAQPPELRSWVMSSSPANPVSLDVHTVRSDDRFVYVESAGLSLHSFGALQANQYAPPSAPRIFAFRIPRHPVPAPSPLETPLGVVGVFVTGVPIYNPIGAVSFNNQNIWHQDAVAASSLGMSPLVASLNNSPSRHSPIIGFALDGYPIYGPFGYDASGALKRMTSSYRLRKITDRKTLPDGTLLTPSQEGPSIGANYPPGAFAEDYEYVAGSGDLDESNGRFAKTPEYPNGTYAYFLTGTWPYLIGPRYHGEAPLDVPARAAAYHAGRVDLFTDCPQIQSGEPVHLTLVFRDSKGRPIRFLEKVHEQPVHLVVVSKDLAEFDHIHPEPVPGDALSVTHAFAHAGDYWVYADYTAPGEQPSIARFALKVTGQPRALVPLKRDTGFTRTQEGVTVTFAPPAQLRAGQDLPLAFTLTDAKTGQPVADLQPWVGAWAHIMMIGEDGKNFIHAHPLESAALASSLLPHTHTVPVAGPSPSTIRTVTGFRSPGLYKLWFQFQRNGQVITMPWVLRVDAAAPSVPAAEPVSGIPVKVSSAGFVPARLAIPANQPVRIAFTRLDAQNCASEVVFPDLNIRKSLPPGQTVTIDLPAQPAGELRFGCGMGMFRGALVVK